MAIGTLERAVKVFLPEGKRTQQYKFSRKNADGSMDQGDALIHHGPHNLAQFRSFDRVMPDGSKTRVEDIIFISSHKQGRVHWVWFNNNDEAWVGEQNDIGQDGLSVRGYGLIGRNEATEGYQMITVTVYRKGDLIIGQTVDMKAKIVSDAMYEPMNNMFENASSRIAEHFGFISVNPEDDALKALQVVAAFGVVAYALYARNERAFLWGMSGLMLVSAVMSMRAQRWNSVVMYMGLSAACAMFAKHR